MNSVMDVDKTKQHVGLFSVVVADCHYGCNATMIPQGYAKVTFLLHKMN